jgi:hypothetical protein
VHPKVRTTRKLKEFPMKQLFLGLASLALIASADVASAKALHHKAHAGNGLVQSDVSLPQSGFDFVRHPNADLKYGPQPDYPQAPPGGGY